MMGYEIHSSSYMVYCTDGDTKIDGARFTNHKQFIDVLN